MKLQRQIGKREARTVGCIAQLLFLGVLGSFVWWLGGALVEDDSDDRAFAVRVVNVANRAAVACIDEAAGERGAVCACKAPVERAAALGFEFAGRYETTPAERQAIDDVGDLLGIFDGCL